MKLPRLPAATQAKIAFLLFCAGWLSVGPEWRSGSPEQATLLTIGCALGSAAYWFGRPRRRLEWIVLPALLALFVLRVGADEPTAAPAGFFAQDPDAPQYDRSMAARGRVTALLKPGLYIVEIQLIGAERKLRYRTASEEVVVRRDRGPGATSGKRSQPAPVLYRYTRRGRLLTRWRFALDESSARLMASPVFRIALRSNQRDLAPGCRLVLRMYGRGAARPAGSDGYGQYLRRKGAVAQAYASNRYHLLQTDCSRLDTPGIFYQVVNQTLRREGELEGESPVRDAALGLLLGKSGFMERKWKQRAVELGVLHLFAASGLHLAIFYGCFFLPLSLLFGARRPEALLPGLLPCFLYAAALDFPPSLLRATTFLSLHALACTFQRWMPRRELLLNAAVVLVFARPEEFLGPGAALSFGACLGILYFFPLLEREAPHGGNRALRWVTAQAAISTAAGLFTIPVIALVFGHYAWFSLPANLILVPLTSLVLPALYFGVAFAALPWPDAFGSVETLALQPAIRGLQLFLAIVREMGALTIAPQNCAIADGADLEGLDAAIALVRDVRLWPPFVCNALLVGALVWMGRADLRRRRLLRRFAWLLILAMGPPGAALLAWLTAGCQN